MVLKWSWKVETPNIKTLLYTDSTCLICLL
jgi:hypothetical protein